MPWQLIYTSAPRGLLSGQSGFCTVARDADLREALVPRLEQISSYHYLRVAEAATAGRNPAISAFRVLDLRGAKYYVLTRIQPCGLDFTGRTNHLAHHLIFQPEELAQLPSPASILRYWPDWRASWQGEPRLLKEVDPASFAAAGKNSLPARTWADLTGDGGRAAGLLEGECVRGCYLLCPPGSEEQVLQMYCETLQLLNSNGQFPLRPWRHTFTTFLQAEDNPNEFTWRGCQENTPAYRQALTRSAPMVALRSVRVPPNSLAKLAREEPKPPPPPASTPDSPSPEPKSALRVKREPPARSVYAPPPVIEEVRLHKTGRVGKPGFLIRVNSATLAGLGICVAVLVVLALIKRNTGPRTVGQGSAPPVSESKPASPSAPPPKSAPADAAPDTKSLDSLVGDGPTYVLAVPNLASFSLPMDLIGGFQRVLHRYDHMDLLPGDIHLTVGTDHWDFPPGAPMIVRGRTNESFSASTPGLNCLFDYADWLAGKSTSLKVRADFQRGAPGAFSMHFGFSQAAGEDPFRLLIVDEGNSPAPMRLSAKFVQYNRQDVTSSLNGPARSCLFTNFYLLAGWKWQLQPWLQSRLGASRYLYKDWPARDVPVFGCELDFGHITQRLQAQRQDLTKRQTTLTEPLGRPLGAFLETNDALASFQLYASNNLTSRHFLDYLIQLRESAPAHSWIKKWHDQFDSDQPEAVAGRLQELYVIWSDKRPQDQSMLTIACATGTTNYFFEVWHNLEELAQVRNELDDTVKRLAELPRVGFVALCAVDPARPEARVEMIRFEGQ